MRLKDAHPKVPLTAEQVQFLYAQADHWRASGMDVKLASAVVAEAAQQPAAKKKEAGKKQAANGGGAPAPPKAAPGPKTRGRPRKMGAAEQARQEQQVRERHHKEVLNDSLTQAMLLYRQLSEDNLAVREGLPAFTKELTDDVIRETAHELTMEAELKPTDFVKLVHDLAAYFNASLDDKLERVKEGFDAGLRELVAAPSEQSGHKNGAEHDENDENEDEEKEDDKEDDKDKVEDEPQDQRGAAAAAAVAAAGDGDDDWKYDGPECFEPPLNKRPRRGQKSSRLEEEEEEDEESLRPVAPPPVATRPAPPPPPPPPPSPAPAAAEVEQGRGESAAKRARTEALMVVPDYAEPQRWAQHPLPRPAGTEGFARLSRFARVEGRHFDGGVAVHLVGPLPQAMGSDGLAPTLLREITKLRTIMYLGLQALRELAAGESVAELALVFTEEPRMHHVAAAAKLDLNQIKCVGRAVAAALYHLHAVGLPHRNLCLENVIYAFDGTVKLADWYWCDSLPSDAVRLAAAPERIFMGLPTRELQEPADLWSLGVVMGSLLLGRPLVTGATLQDQRWNTEVLVGSPAERDWKARALFAVCWTLLADLFLCDQELFESGKYVPRAAPRYSTLDSVLAKCMGSANPKSGLQFLERLLRYDPARRTPIHRVLQAPWLVEERAAVVHLPPFPVKK